MKNQLVSVMVTKLPLMSLSIQKCRLEISYFIKTFPYPNIFEVKINRTSSFGLIMFNLNFWFDSKNGLSFKAELFSIMLMSTYSEATAININIFFYKYCSAVNMQIIYAMHLLITSKHSIKQALPTFHR